VILWWLGIVAMVAASTVAAIWWDRQRKHAVSCLRLGFLPHWSPDSFLRSWILQEAMEKLVKEEAAAEAWEHEDFEYEISPLTVAYLAKKRLKEMRHERLAAIVHARERDVLR
jgi:hypothetical protein